MKFEKGGLFFIGRLLIIIQCNFFATLSFMKRDHTKALLKKSKPAGSLTLFTIKRLQSKD